MLDVLRLALSGISFHVRPVAVRYSGSAVVQKEVIEAWRGLCS